MHTNMEGKVVLVPSCRYMAPMPRRLPNNHPVSGRRLWV